MRRFFWVAVACMCMAFWHNASASEATKPKSSPARLLKIHDFLNDPQITPTGGNQPLIQEMKYFNHGAVTEKQKLERKGHYYVVNWTNQGEPSDFVLRFEYRQTATKDAVFMIETPVEQSRGSKKTTFSVTGDAYEKGGNVTSWQISLLKDGHIVDQKRSYIW